IELVGFPRSVPTRSCSAGARPRAPYTFPYTPLFRSRANRVADTANILVNHGSVLFGGFDSRSGVALADDLEPAKQDAPVIDENRSEEHTSELQSRGHLVCRLLLEKKT